MNDDMKLLTNAMNATTTLTQASLYCGLAMKGYVSTPSYAPGSVSLVNHFRKAMSPSIGFLSAISMVFWRTVLRYSILVS